MLEGGIMLPQSRMQYQPPLPDMFENFTSLTIIPGKSQEPRPLKVSPALATFFPKTLNQTPYLSFMNGSKGSHEPKRVGVVFSGGQAPGGHNVITGLYDALKKLNPKSELFGFCDGPKGILENIYIPLTSEKLDQYRNQGGFDLLGSGRTKIETPEQFQAVAETMKGLNLDGLVIIGGDDSNTNAALLAEYFLANDCKTVVIGVPKTIDNDLTNQDIEVSFGFDTATKIYAEIIGNLARDALSAKKSYFFVKLMGRSASHITLECALKVHPNLVLISEEIATQQKTLRQIVDEICDVIEIRSKKNRDYGVILIPEGIVEFIPEFQQLIEELNHLMTDERSIDCAMQHLSAPALNCFTALPNEIQMQLLLDRDPHGNVQVSKIETERLFLELVQQELKIRKKNGTYVGKFSGQPFFCGYEGRSGLPSNFDAKYCYTLGHVAALLVNANVTGYICSVQGLAGPSHQWQVGGRSLLTMMKLEKRKGKEKPVIAKTLVDLQGKKFSQLMSQRTRWATEDDYRYPGPMQFID